MGNEDTRSQMVYSPTMTLREARALYFSLNGFGENGGYEERWIKVKVWKFPIWLPNTKGRREAVRFHDLHHVLTEYPTTWRGEAEISAWEVGSGGLKNYYAGWILDLMNIAQGLVVAPGGVYRGFMRGRETQSLYAREFTEELLDSGVGEYRRRLRLDTPTGVPGAVDYVMFVFWVVISALTYIVAISAALLPVLLFGLLVLWTFGVYFD